MTKVTPEVAALIEDNEALKTERDRLHAALAFYATSEYVILKDAITDGAGVWVEHDGTGPSIAAALVKLHEAISARLTHLDKLERTLAWREQNLFRLRSLQYPFEWVYGELDKPIEREPHDGTPSGRAAALVRLYERVTGAV